MPEGLEPGSPFGGTLAALIVHLHVTQAISFERLVVLLDEVFGVDISEGAIANLLARAQAPLVAAAEAIGDEVRSSPVIGSDETSARVAGRTWWQWVLLSSTAIHHILTVPRAAETVPRAAETVPRAAETVPRAAETVPRAAETVTTFLNGAVPEVWGADRSAGQKGHGRERQLCLAHLLRDAQYAIEDGDTVFAPGFKMLLLRAMAIGRRRDELKDSTLKQYRADLDRRLDRLLARQPTASAARKLRKGLLRCRADLFRFVTRRDVP